MKQIFLNDIKNFKPAVIDWLIAKFNLDINYKHSFADQWIRVNIWDGQLSISFDKRQNEQVELFNALPNEIKGTPQHVTGIMVNLDNLYFDMNKEFAIEYPEIISKKITGKHKQRGGTGGWHSPSDDFYTYDWEVALSDGTKMVFTNQDESKLDIEKWNYPTRIQELYFSNLVCGGILKV